MAQLEASYRQDDGACSLTGADIVDQAAGQRRRAAQHRARAAELRALAAEDRHHAARDREQAARERLDALADREALACELAIAETDPLTGARTRAAGLIDLDHELDRCRRTNASLVVAYLDVVGLKTLNDAEGHSAGDALIKRVLALTQAHLRSYDLIIRLGGDEFLCAMSGMTMSEAHQRFATITTALAASPDGGAIRTGFAQLTPDQTADELIARADSELIGSRRTTHRQPQAAEETSANHAR